MRRPSSRTKLQVEAVEARWLPSGVPLVLTSRMYDAVAADVMNVVANLAKTQNAVRAEESLTRISTRIPFESTQLASTWVNNLASFNRAVPGSRQATTKLLLADLKRDVAAGVAAGTIRVIGRHAPTFPRPGQGGGGGGGGGGTPAPQSSLDSVRVANNTNLTLTVTVTLSNTRRFITKTIPRSTTPALFDFGSTTGNFMTITIKNANGASPPAYTTNLNRPISGYNGALFGVSVFGGYFSVSS